MYEVIKMQEEEYYRKNNMPKKYNYMAGGRNNGYFWVRKKDALAFAENLLSYLEKNIVENTALNDELKPLIINSIMERRKQKK